MPALPVDVSRTIEDLLTILPLDVCHVHEPFAPSTSSAALRHSRALNVGTFHTPDRAAALDAGRAQGRAARARPPRRAHGELRRDARAHAALLPRRLPRAAARRRPPRGTRGRRPAPRGSCSSTTRSARRCGCSCARCAGWTPTAPWEATIVSARGPSSSTPLRADLQARVRYATPDELPEAEALARADILVAASDGAAPAPGLVLRALNAGAVPLASRLPVYEELLDEGEHGLLFEPRDADTLAAQLAAAHRRRRAARAPAERAAPLRERLRWSRVADELEDVYARLVARRHPLGGQPRDRRPAAHAGRASTSTCTCTPTTRTTARRPSRCCSRRRATQGLGAIAVTDHNVITGALEAREKAAEFGVKVIVAEEVKTADQGEVIGLFIEEHIPRGMTLAETVAEIKRQGGLVYVPHPFDRMHAVPDYEHLLDDRRRHRRDRGLQPARRDRLVQRGGRALRRQVPDPRGRRIGLARRARASARCASGWPTSTARRSSSRRCARPRSRRSRRRCCTSRR